MLTTARATASAITLAVVLAACGAAGSGDDEVAGAPSPADASASADASATDGTEGTASDTPPPTVERPTSGPSGAPDLATTEPDDPTSDPVDPDDGAIADGVLTAEELQAFGVDELGRVLVAEWHLIGDTDGDYRTSRETLRRQLEELYARGYRPVTEAEFVAGTFPIPAGTSPVVLTFDDSTRGQLDIGPDGQPLPDTAVGIIEAFAAEHDDWRATAVFGFNFPEPFGDAGHADELRWLVDNGYELSNHSLGHTNLGSLAPTEVVANLAANQALLQAVVPDARVASLTLPFGVRASDPEVELRGTADGTSYEHDLVYLVGSDPTRSPHHTAFDPAAVQRVPAHAVVGSDESWFWDWLDRLDEESLRFVSDGDPTTVTYPSSMAEVAAVDTSRHRVREY